MTTTLTYQIGPLAHPAGSVAGGKDDSRIWLDVVGPGQRQTRAMADRIAMLESKLAALEAASAAAK